MLIAKAIGRHLTLNALHMLGHYMTASGVSAIERKRERKSDDDLLALKLHNFNCHKTSQSTSIISYCLAPKPFINITSITCPVSHNNKTHNQRTGDTTKCVFNTTSFMFAKCIKYLN